MSLATTTTVRIVCFDLGGVLVRIYYTWREACAAAGLAERDEPSSPEVEAKRRAFDASFALGRISVEQWAAGVSSAFEGAYSPDEAKRAHHAILRTEYPGAPAVIDSLHNAGVTTACLSNTDHAHWVRLVHRDGDRSLAGPPEYPSIARLKRPFASHLLGLAKPDDAIYAAFEELTRLRGAEILFFDDRPENVEAARRHDWQAHRIDPQGRPMAQAEEHLRQAGVI